MTKPRFPGDISMELYLSARSIYHECSLDSIWLRSLYFSDLERVSLYSFFYMDGFIIQCRDRKDRLGDESDEHLWCRLEGELYEATSII